MLPVRPEPFTPFKNTVTEEPDFAGFAQELTVPSLFNAIAWNVPPNAAWPQVEVKVVEFTKTLGLLAATANCRVAVAGAPPFVEATDTVITVDASCATS